MNTKLRKGQIVYIQGLYKAKIVEVYEEFRSARCLVYEGLPGYSKPPEEYTYDLFLLKTEKERGKCKTCKGKTVKDGRCSWCQNSME